MKDIAAVLDISVVTVSRALKDHPDIGADTKKRVRDVAEELGYQPNLVARSLATQRSFTIGLLIPDLMHSFFAEVCRGVERKVAPQGYHVFIANTDENPVIEEGHVNSLLARRVDGMILASAQPAGNLAFFEGLRRRDVPYVLIDRRHPDLAASYVGVDDEQIGALATEHLVERGCRRIAHLRGQPIPPGEGRLRGYRNTLTRHGLELEEDYLEEAPATDDAGYRAMRKLLRLRPRPDGVFCYNDPVAIGAMKAVFEAGLRVPRDIAIVGAGNVRYSESLRVPLTTVDQCSSVIGETSGELLLRSILEPGDCKPETIVMTAKLVVRESSCYGGF
jgi:LacI family transcriptional regulator, galactose operon repressor